MLEVEEAASHDEDGRLLRAEEGIPLEDADEKEEKLSGYSEHVRPHFRIRLPRWSIESPTACSVITAVSGWCVSTSFLGLFLSFLRFFIPSPFQKSNGEEKKEAKDTAWLDGLRGLAAFWVVNSHLASLLVKWTGSGWGHADSGEEVHHEFFMFPFVRLIYSGGFSVYIFFVISGYALSLAPIRRMNSQECAQGSALRSMASSALRRPLRLYLPAFASTLIAFFFIRLRLFEYCYTVYEASPVVNGWDTWFHDFPSGNRSFFSQLYNLIDENKNLFKILQQPRTAYNLVLWTIPQEFKGSIALYIVHLGFFFLRRPVRLLLAACTILLSIYIDMFYLHLFLVGYVFAEIDCARSPEEAKARNPLWRTILWVLVTILALWLGSMPEYKPEETPMYVTLGKINPLHLDKPSQAWHRVAAILLFAGLSQERILRWPFQTALGRYMGRLSFSLYLCHLPILVVVGTLVFNSFLTATGSDLAIVGFFGAYLVTAIPIWYVSDRFEAAVDSKSISLGHRLENYLVREEFKR